MVCSFPPEISAGRLEYELSEALLNSGHSLEIVTAIPRRYLLNNAICKRAGRFSYTEKINGLHIRRMGPEFSQRDNLVSRGLEYFLDLIIFGLGGLVSKRPDVILSSSPPMSIGLAGWLIARLRKVPVVLRVGDIHPQALIDLGLVKNPAFIGILRIMENLLYRQVDHIIVLSETYRQDLIKKGVKPSKITVIPNWSNVGEVSISEKQAITLQKDIQTSGAFVVTYAGFMSWPQDLETLIDCASLLSNYNITFCLVGDGPQRKQLEERSRKLNLSNVRFLPLQPRPVYLNILRMSDVCLVSLKGSYKSPAVPSKLIDIMACGKPVIANVPMEGDVPKIINDAKCGLWVEPQNPTAFSQAVQNMFNNAELCSTMGKNGLDYFKAHYTLQSCMKRYEQIILEQSMNSLSHDSRIKK